MVEIDNRRFYNAGDAYKMARKVNEEIEHKSLIELFDQIDSYVRAGEYECIFVKLSTFQKEWLEEHNYKVTIICKPDHYTNGMFKVNWNK